MLMYSIQEDEMTLSASNPDLALYEGPADEKYDADGNRIERSVYSREWINNPCGETTISLTLNGHWEITEYNGCKVGISRADGQTKLIFTSKEARTEEIKLRRTTL
jgi:chondroitin-sulfate-ABC endolyase/exolyase